MSTNQENKSVQEKEPVAVMPGGECIPVRWEGAQFVWHSLAHVNRQLCRALMAIGQVELSLIPTDAHQFSAEQEPCLKALAERFFSPLSQPAVVHVRHAFPPRLAPPPDEGHFILIQPWEYGFLPKHWTTPIQEQVSEVWCPSRYVRDVYCASGIAEEQLHIVPNGVNTEVFHPDAPPYVFTSESGAARLPRVQERFVFLFTGGTLHRKGIDILLEAYRRAFTANESVCLVIKDTCTQTAYRGLNQKEHILSLVSDAACPPIIYLDADLSDHQLAGIYTACDCLVQPYRGEGFCLPALEAMACGRPVIVSEGGATDDFVDQSVGWQIPARKCPLGGNWIGEWECAGPPWMLEVSPDDLGRLLRHVYQEREEGRRRGRAAVQRVQEGWTWQHAAAKVLQRLTVLQHRPVSRPERPKSFAPANQSLGLAHLRLVTEESSEPAKPQEELSIPVTASKRPTISLCMIVRDEERVLGECLKSAKPWVDEMIVVDTGSTDRTIQIAKSVGATVYSFPWTDSFAQARNESLKYASGDWIFWMDADDTLPAHSGEAIRQAACSAPEEIAGFVIPVQFVEDSALATGTRVDHVKLFRNRPGIAFEGRIHEQILPSLRATGGLIARCAAVVLHSGYDTSPEGQAKKRARDAKLLLLDLQERPNHPFVLFNLGMTDHYCGMHELAIEWLKKCLAVSVPEESHVRKAYALLAVSLRELGKANECLQAIEEGLCVTPADPELHFQAGYTLTALGRYEEAKSHYTNVVGSDIAAHFSSVDIGILGFKTFHNLGSVCMLLGEYLEAKQWWLKAVGAAPQFLPSVFELFTASIQAQDFTTAQQMLDAVWKVEGASENWSLMGVRYGEATHEAGKAEGFLRDAVGSYPAAIGPRLVLARRLLQSGREEEAGGHLAALNDQGVAEAAFYLGVSATRKGHLKTALAWMQRASALNPSHRETQEQLANLQIALASNAYP